jgi:hypothetical protein
MIDGRTYRRLREYLFLSHGHSGQYVDDGELQCVQCAPYGVVDYSREPLETLLDALESVGRDRVFAALGTQTLRPR